MHNLHDLRVAWRGSRMRGDGPYGNRLRSTWAAWRIIELTVEAAALADSLGTKFSRFAAMRAARSMALQLGVPRALIERMCRDALRERGRGSAIGPRRRRAPESSRQIHRVFSGK